jgi:hypothetical protein
VAHSIDAKIELEVRRKNGEVIHQNFPCQSFTKWFKRLCTNFFTGMGTRGFTLLKLVDINGVERGVGYNYSIKETYIIDNIAIGKSDEPFDYTQYHLKDFYAWATGLVMSKDNQDFDTSTLFELTGTFDIKENVTIKETGLYGRTYDAGGVLVRFLVSRDVLPDPIDLYPGDVLIVRYRVLVS